MKSSFLWLEVIEILNYFLVLYLYEAKHRPIALFFKSYGRASYKYEVTKQIVLSHYVFSDICPKPDDFRLVFPFFSPALGPKFPVLQFENGRFSQKWMVRSHFDGVIQGLPFYGCRTVQL